MQPWLFNKNYKKIYGCIAFSVKLPLNTVKNNLHLFDTGYKYDCSLQFHITTAVYENIQLVYIVVKV